jgi:hypothetical protein
VQPGDRLEIPRPPGGSLHLYEHFEVEAAAPEPARGPSLERGALRVFSAG